MAGRARIGTSGWSYRWWVGPFYPPGLPARSWLDFYAGRFDATEINNSFYRVPSRETLTRWRDGTPPDFLFAAKASSFITHAKKLTDPAESCRRLFDALEALEPKLGPILFQLPPRWRKDAGRLEAFLGALPRRWRYAFELREASWHGDDIRNLLTAHDAAFCIWDLGGVQSPITVTADFVYVRLHGPDGSYYGSYADPTLAAWAARIRAWTTEGRDVFVFFDNDPEGFAPRDALRLKGMLEAVE